jgi:hypothetical protein
MPDRTPIPANAIEPTNQLLTILDLAFGLGGKLLDMAKQTAPELNTSETGSGEAIDKMMSARERALERAAEEAPKSEYPDESKD